MPDSRSISGDTWREDGFQDWAVDDKDEIAMNECRKEYVLGITRYTWVLALSDA